MKELMPLLWAIFYVVITLTVLGAAVQVWLIVQAKKAAQKVQDSVLGVFKSADSVTTDPFRPFQ